MATALQLDIVTPDQLVLSREVEYVGAPGVLGEFGILPGHVPFISALTIGRLYYKVGGKDHYVFVSGGFAEVSDNRVTILAESAEEAEKIDFNRAERALKRAKQRLDAKNAELNFKRATLALYRATERLSLQNRI
ncbi:MAG: F0F1 ATP synthase subunit epsilon [Desulfovibrio sp.]|jgi:F-type H+-transporting ATPase subunit epsilon|nr:F0F1 ATP synthase subunit epsilon [Desulfovibrio sp.]